MTMDNSLVVLLLPLIVILGMLIGGIGSFVALRRFLEV